MTVSKTKNAFYNISFALFLQIVTVISGLILPRLIIPKYGSEINGLIISINQFLTYIALLEAGAEGVFRTAMYEPFANNDFKRISKIFNTSKRFFKKIALILIVYILALCVIFPLLVNQNNDWKFTILMILILSISTFFQYFVSIPYISVLSAAQKVRIVYVIDAILILLNVLVSYVLILLNTNILIVKLCSTLLFVLKPMFFIIYVKKKYPLEKTTELDDISLSNQRYGFIHHLAQFIHTNADVIIITLILGVKDVSVYAVYYAVVSGVERIISSFSVGSAAGIGTVLSENNKEKSTDLIEKYEFIQGSLTTLLFTITAIMLMPFISLYTSNMIDANYIDETFGYLLILANSMYCFRLIYSTITLNGNKYKETILGAILECLVNIIISLVLVWKFGLVGVAIGTLIGMFVRYIFELIYLRNNLIKRKLYKPLSFLIVNVVISCFSIFVGQKIVNNFFVSTWESWIFSAILVSVITAIVCLLFYSVFYRKRMFKVLNILLQILKKNH